MNYFNEINKRFGILNTIFSSILISITIYLIDYYNLLNKIITTHKVMILCLIIVCVSYIIKEFVNKKLWNLFCIETINYFDKLLLIGIFTELILGSYYFFDNINFLKFIITIGIINVVIILIRLIRIKNLIKMMKKKEKKCNVYTISKLYNKEIKDEKLVLLEEKELKNSQDDLLDINLFVGSIEDSLLQCNPNENFVISLIGKWGCGKTSVINLLKQKINNGNNAVIDTFNPWKYDNKFSLFEGFYKYIFKALNKNYGYVSYKKLLKKYEKTIFSFIENKTSISLMDIINLNDDRDIEEIKDSINDFIKFTDKKIIVVIDDIDRLNKEQILFVFKTIKTLFNFNNIVYILCYDEERINKIFDEELKIDNCYLDKIVQDKIVMPIIDNNVLCNIGSQCILNLISIYKIEKYDKERLKNVLNLIFKDFQNVREIIRFINIISISIKCCSKLGLDICDFITLEYIKFKDLKLYNYIYKNNNMFVSIDTNYNIDYDFLSTDKFNEKAKKFYEDTFKDNDNIEEILATVFPYIDNYRKNHPIKDNYYFITDDRKKSILNKRCHNGRFFKCYFTIKHSFFTALNYLLTTFINNINNNKNIQLEFNKIIKEVHPNNHDLLFELLEMRLDEINDREKIFDYIFNNISDYEDGVRFLGLNSNERAKILLASIINLETDIDKKKSYLDIICKKDLLLLDSVLYWLGTDKYGNTKEDDIYKYGKDILCNKLNILYENKVDVFNYKKYKRHFCWLFYRNFDDKEKYKKYLKKIINKDNIFRVISECINTFVGNGISYQYKESSLKELFGLDDLDEMLKSIDYKLNSDQEKVKELYNNKNEKSFNGDIDFNNL